MRFILWWSYRLLAYNYIITSSFLLIFLRFYIYFRQFSPFQLPVKFLEGLFCRMHNITFLWPYRALNYPEYRFWHELEVKWSILFMASMFFQIALRGGEYSPYSGGWEILLEEVFSSGGGNLRRRDLHHVDLFQS